MIEPPPLSRRPSAEALRRRSAVGSPGYATSRLFTLPAERSVALVAWVAAIVVSFVLIALVGFRSGDPDSTVYAGISARLATEPLARWIAPEWWGYWGFTGPFREHPIGILIVPALIGRIGYPPLQAAYAVNGLFQIASILLLQVLAAQLVRPREARALGWIVQLTPIAFVFRVRANQEYAVLAGVLLGLFGTERSWRRPAWASIAAVAFAWTLLVKGVFGFVVPITCGVWLAIVTWVEGHAHARGDGARRSRLSTAWLALAGVLLVAPVLAGLYEHAYVRATGDSFLAFYTGPRLQPEAVAVGALNRVAYNTIWYTARLAWYAFPWSLVGLTAFAMGARRLRAARGADATTGESATGRGGPTGVEDEAIDAGAVRGLCFAVAASFLLIVLFSFSDRKADRFLFPAYYFMAAAGGVAAIRYSPALARMVERLDRPWIPAACWMSLFLLRLATGSHLPQFTFWRS